MQELLQLHHPAPRLAKNVPVALFYSIQESLQFHHPKSPLA